MIRIPPLQELRNRDPFHFEFVESLVSFAATSVGVDVENPAAWIEANVMFRDEVQVYLMKQERRGRRNYKMAEHQAINNIRVLLAATER